MFVYSLSGKSLKTALLAVVAFVFIVGAIMILPDYDATGNAYISAYANESISFVGIKTEEDRQDFISKFGIAVSGNPIEEYEAKIPKSFDSVYEEYNNIQKAQGLDLSRFRGKSFKRYTYEITNYPKNAEGEPSGKVFLNLIQHKNRIIAGDISSSSMGGFVKTFCDFKA